MKKTRLLNSEISYMIARMGHFDTVCVCDAGLPIPEGPKRIDIALEAGVPSFEQALEAMLSELCVQRVFIASEMSSKNSELYRAMRERFTGAEIVEMPHGEFKVKTKACVAVVRTGETKPYANIILESGVVF